MKLDFHVHTHYSIDSIIKPKELAIKSQKNGIIFANTDHNTIEAHKVFKELGVPFIPGEEIRTDRGDLIALYLNELIPKHTPFDEAIDKIHEQGALAYLPHMFDKTRKGVIPNSKEVSKIDIIEIFNSRCIKSQYNTQAANFALENSKIGALGSDSHFLFEFGTSFNEVPDFDLQNPKSLLQSLRRAKFNSISAPFYVRGTTTLIALSKKFRKKFGF